jgi:hypothetical protein
VLFTGLLAFLSYVTERPQVAVHITPLRNFVKGGTPREVIVFENVGRLPANSLQSAVELPVLQSPLGNSHFTEMPLTSIPFDLFAGTENEKGRAVDLQQPISDTDYAAVLEGKTKQIYVRGIVQYEDLLRTHREHFCFAFSGVGASSSVPSEEIQASICSVENPPEYQEPHAHPAAPAE